MSPNSNTAKAPLAQPAGLHATIKQGRAVSRASLLLSVILSVPTVSPLYADSIVAWGDNSNNQLAVPPGLTDAIAIVAGGGHNVAIRADHTVVVWGYNPFGQLDVPAGLTKVVAVAAGYDHSLALRSDGTVVGWGRNSEGQTNVPAGLANVVAVSANGHHSLVLSADGTVLAWGDNSDGQGTIPAGLGNVIAISSGPWHNLALLHDRTVVGWGRNDQGQSAVPPALTDVVAIAAGGEHNLALKADGTVVAWGRNDLGQTEVAAGLSNVVGIAAGFAHSLVLTADGLVFARGWNDFGQATVPAGLASVRGISAGFRHSLALVGVPDSPPTIRCPSDVELSCTNCNTDPDHTGRASAQDNGIVEITYSDSVSGDCPKVVTRTWTATDESGQSASCAQRIVCRAEDTPPTITCPPDVILFCRACNTDPSHTGEATAQDNGMVRVTYQDSVSGDCPKVVTRTWTATDDSGKSASCAQRIVCQGEDTPPTITCPPDVMLSCRDCNTDPSHTGQATAQDNGLVRVTYQDSVSGDCPKVVTRTWTATDEATNTASCVQTITCLPSSLVTDSSWCVFDRDPETGGQEFRLLFTHDPRHRLAYKVTASNPGQFFYNVFQTGTPGQRVTFNITLPYPFITRGARPIHAYDGVTVEAGGDGLCLRPGDAFFASPRRVTLAHYGAVPNPSTTVPVTVTVPRSGVVFLTLHLDYGLKRRGGYVPNALGDAVDRATGKRVLIPNRGTYTFSVSGAQDDATSIQNINDFKGNPHDQVGGGAGGGGGVGGQARSRSSTGPVAGARVILFRSGGVVVNSTVTDEDGFYHLPYKHTGKPILYYVSLGTAGGYTQTKAVSLHGNRYVQLEFLTP